MKGGFTEQIGVFVEKKLLDYLKKCNFAA